LELANNLRTEVMLKKASVDDWKLETREHLNSRLKDFTTYRAMSSCPSEMFKTAAGNDNLKTGGTRKRSGPEGG
jgi:hypothetical protein